ncbi:ras GTPase-activating protein [Lactarius vividus]|nr:ras GTPase-activating protein [Lactarius vividus]
MERSDSSASSSSVRSGRPNSSIGFAYQARLLERGSTNTASLSRAGSVSAVNSLSTGNSTSTSTTRRWTPSHRIGSSLDAVRGKWEERVRAEAVIDEKDLPSVPSESSDSRPPRTSSPSSDSTEASSLPSRTQALSDAQRTPTYSKPRTTPAPIIASPLSPNSTGISVINPDPARPSSNTSFTDVAYRIRLPSSTSATTGSPAVLSDATSDGNSDLPPLNVARSRARTVNDVPSKAARSSTTFDAFSTPLKEESPSWRINPSRKDLSKSGRIRPTSVYEDLITNTDHVGREQSSPSPRATSSSRSRDVPFDVVGNIPARSGALQDSFQSSSMPPPAMHPTPYKSTYKSPYMTSRKASTYGENLIVGRKLGRHLPRIASGDADDSWVADDDVQMQREEEKARNERQKWREQRLERRPALRQRESRESIATSAATPDGVVGIPGRLKLSRDKVPSSPTSSPLSAARSTRGLWADTQRHLMQAYEYLCHVGEAQQWIEGCLGEELGFGVVDMEESLRNGVVLAKLVRVFQGEAVVRRIYEAPKLDFRHSDNINYFFNFVRHVGLPESFIFELTDLYEKKNLPKVIYCIHALSHLLARRGLAERIGNLLGRLQFSDDQLQRTQKGLKDAGVPMPNFGNVGRELALEINEEPEETEEEIRDRLLLENESSIISVQTLARGFLARKAQATQTARLQLTQRYVVRVQAQSRGVLTRRAISYYREQQARLLPWVVALQAACRAGLLRRRWHAWIRRIKGHSQSVVKIQAQIRGYLVRRRFARLHTAFQRSVLSVTKMQAQARARIVQRKQDQLMKVFSTRKVFGSIVKLQAAARGAIRRAAIARKLNVLDRLEGSIIALQAQAAGVLVRRRVGTQLAKLENITDIVVRIQAAVRTYLARKRLLVLIRGLRKATPIIVQLQARARANLTQHHHKALHKTLSKVEVAKSVGGFQALARAALSRNRHREQIKRLEFSLPDVLGFQAVARGFLVRRDWHAWRDHLRRSHSVASALQALFRGVLQRKKFREKMQYYRENLHKVVKIQSLFRAKETREQYRQLTMGSNVSVGTIKNFVHLLDDSEADFQEELDLERMRKQVVERIRENQALENDVNDLDVKIALVVHNVKTFEELVKVRRKYGADTAAAHASRASVLAAHGDPFAGPSALDHAAKRKLELYQQLFYLLQSRGEYLARLFLEISGDNVPEKDRRLLERVVLTLFGYGQDRREDYLLLKLFQFSITEEVEYAKTLADVIHGHPVYINIALHYIRPKQTVHIREALQPLIRDVVATEDLDLEVDPKQIYRARIDLEEMRAGKAISKSKDISFTQALNDPVTRPEYIRHLQVLRWWTEAFITAVMQSTKKMPYGIRYLARETLVAIRNKFPDAPDEACAICVGRLIFYRYINPAIITPETFDIVSSTVDVSSRKNLAQISKVLAQITSCSEFGDDMPSYIPINEYVTKAISQFTAWLLEVADVPDAETQYHAHEFLDVTVQPKPIYISPNEVYAMHGLLAQHIDRLGTGRDDALRIILQELDGVPQFGNEELKDARDRAITLELTNRFAHVRDPRADEKTLWVQAKRTVLAILRVQPAKDLVESLMQPVSALHETTWEDILESEMESDHRLRHPRRAPSAAAQESAYRLEDIRSLSFHEVKAHAIFFLLELEKQGKITRNDGYQGILNAIAHDVRSKHRMRLQRQQEIENMAEALQHLNERKKYFEEQINSYNSYVEVAMATMQRGKSKKRIIMPFTKQYFHLRDLQKSGKTPQFGSFKYSAQDLYERGILLSIDQFSPRQFDRIDLVISSNQLGVFTIEAFNNTLGITNRMAVADVRLEDLLQAQYQDRASLSLFNGLAKFNLNLLLYQINKKFYV